MNEKLRGGVETIIAVIIITALVVVLIISTVIPVARETNEMGQNARSDLQTLQGQMGYDD